MDNQGFAVTDGADMQDQIKTADKLRCNIESALYAKSEHSAETMLQILAGQLMSPG